MNKLTVNTANILGLTLFLGISSASYAIQCDPSSYELTLGSSDINTYQMHTNNRSCTAEEHTTCSLCVGDDTKGAMITGKSIKKVFVPVSQSKPLIICKDGGCQASPPL